MPKLTPYFDNGLSMCQAVYIQVWYWGRVLLQPYIYRCGMTRVTTATAIGWFFCKVSRLTSHALRFSNLTFIFVYYRKGSEMGLFTKMMSNITKICSLQPFPLSFSLTLSQFLLISHIFPWLCLFFILYKNGTLIGQFHKRWSKILNVFPFLVLCSVNGSWKHSFSVCRKIIKSGYQPYKYMGVYYV